MPIISASVLQETWMYPAILPFRPDLAKEMLNYRVRNMEKAVERAQDGGFNGARLIKHSYRLLELRQYKNDSQQNAKISKNIETFM